MRRFAMLYAAAIGCGLVVTGAFSGCGGQTKSTGFDQPPSSSSSSSSSGGSSSGGDDGGEQQRCSGGTNNTNVGSFGDAIAPPPMQVASDSGIACPSGLLCDYDCADAGKAGTATTITGKVYDPAGKNPLYNVSVYVPVSQLQPLPKGVPTGADACSCPALFKSGALTATSTAVDGTFTLKDAPIGDVTLVLQVGKWRRAIKITTKACVDNAQPDKSLTLPGTTHGGSRAGRQHARHRGLHRRRRCTPLEVPDDTHRRTGAAEYVAGTATTGHVHIFSGGGAGGGGGGGGGGAGRPEQNVMPGAPVSSTALWDTADHLMPYDITLLSCEGRRDARTPIPPHSKRI